MRIINKLARLIGFDGRDIDSKTWINILIVLSNNIQ